MSPKHVKTINSSKPIRSTRINFFFSSSSSSFVANECFIWCCSTTVEESVETRSPFDTRWATKIMANSWWLRIFIVRHSSLLSVFLRKTFVRTGFLGFGYRISLEAAKNFDAGKRPICKRMTRVPHQKPMLINIQIKSVFISGKECQTPI